MRCFLCLSNFDEPEKLFDHIKHHHGICGNSEFRCSFCSNQFDNFGGFKKHTRKCFQKGNTNHESEQPRHDETIDEAFEMWNELDIEYSDEIAAYKEFVEKRALEMVVDMSANMSIPRNLVFKTISKFQKFISETYIHGLKTIIVPRLGVISEELTHMKRFIKSIEKPFDQFNTESNLDSVLLKMDIMKPIVKCLLKKDPMQDPLDNPCKKRRIDLNKPSNIEDEVQDEESTMMLMPISFTLQKFFELPKVYEIIEKHTNEIRNNQQLDHFINGKLWKEKLRNFNIEDTVIPYFLYIDGAQTNNPLGPHCTKGMLDFSYITLPTIPTEYQSKLENIFVASISPDNKQFGIESVSNNLIDELTKLANDGVVLTINGDQKKVFFVCGAFIGDNKESNAYLGFIRSFKAGFYCRFCRMHRSEMQRASVEIPEKRRNRQNYVEDVIINDQSKTGIAEYSHFNEIPFFHVTDSSAEDSTHIVDEGIVHYCLVPSLRYFIYERRYFTVQELNKRIKLFDYCEDEKQNIPMPILEIILKKIKREKCKMTASEMANFVHNLIFIIGDLIDEEDEVWKFLLTTIKFFDLAYLPCYNEDDFAELSQTVAIMNDQYQNLFDKTLKPVQHFATHYPADTRNFGPLRYLRTIRCEGRHKPIKSYTKNTPNRIDICYSIGKKEQYNLAQRILQLRGLNDSITAKAYDKSSIKTKVYYEKLSPSIYKESLSEHMCSFTKKVEINGMVFKLGSWLPDAADKSNSKVSQILEICDIVLLLQNETILELFAVCKSYSVLNADNNICHIVDMSTVQSQYIIINIREYLKYHHYPVKLHEVKGKLMFRFKRF